MPMMKGPLLACGYKHCFSCRTSKPVAEFYRRKDKPDGFSSQCKGCEKKTAKGVRERRTILQEAYRRSQERGGGGLRMIDLIGLDAAVMELTA